MRLTIFGLTVSSSWGNGHASIWRALIAALGRAGHAVTFFERDVTYYAENRDLAALPPPHRLVLYRDWAEVRATAARALAGSDAAIVTSYCPDGREASRVVLDSAARVRCFYDLDTPVTLAALAAGRVPDYLPEPGLGGFDLVLSYTGGAALEALRTRLGARRVAPLYGCVDPEAHRPVPARPEYRADLSYLGTYAEDRQATLLDLFIEPARRRPKRRFVLGGAQYPGAFPWADNIFFVRHVPPPLHPAFYSSGRLTLNVTRGAMAAMGWCPSGRLFEAAACGAPVLSDAWDGIECFFTPGEEILIARRTEDVLAALDLAEAELARIAAAARARCLERHGAARRAEELALALDAARLPQEA